jgi:hypothetical protein
MTVDPYKKIDINTTSNKFFYKDIVMIINKISFKKCVGSLALMSACVLSTHASAENQTYMCSYTIYDSHGGSGQEAKSSDVQASSVQGAKDIIVAMYKSSSGATTYGDSRISCALKN